MGEVYVVVAEIRCEDVSCDTTNVIGVFDNDNDSLEFNETYVGYEYHSNYDFYNVNVKVYPRTIGDSTTYKDFYLTQII